MEVNKEYELLAKFTADLSNLLQHNVVSVSGRLLEKGLVTKDVHDSMLTTEGVSGQKNAARLMSCVLDRVKYSSRCFHDFISVLREDAYFEDVVVKILEVHTSPQEQLALPHSEQPVQSTPSPSPVGTVGEPSCGLEGQIDQLDQQYIEIETLVLETIKAQKLPLDKVLNWIRFPPTKLRTQFADFLQSRAKLLSSSTSIDELFTIVSSYWNLFHPALLQHLVNKLGDEDIKSQMDRYMVDLHHFRIQTTLGDFLDKWVGDIPPDYQEFVLELGEEWRKKTVEDLEQFRIRLSRLQSFGGGHMSFMKTAKSSSVLVVLVLPAQLFPLNVRSTTLHKLLRDENIVRVMVDGQYVFDSNELAECERELLKLCADKYSDITKIQHLLNQPAVDPNIFDEEGHCPLWLSCGLGRADVAILLLDCGADADLPTDNQYGESPLIAASWCGHVALCKVLIERGATVDFQTKGHTMPLYLASQYGRKEVVELLLDSGAIVDKPNMDTRSSALIVACQCGHPEVAAVLIARGATVDYKAENGITPLFMASTKGHKEVAQLLLQNGAQPDIPRNDTATPLTMASECGHADICQLLIQHGSEVNYHEKDGRTALVWAAFGGNQQTVNVLLNAGANPDIQDQEGLTPLILATQRGHKDVVKSLLQSKANPNMTDKTAGRSALFFAVDEGNVKIAKILVNDRADVDLKDKNGLTPLDTAKLNNQKEMYKLLQKHSRSESRKDITEEQKKRATTFTRRLRKLFDNLEWMFLRGRVLKQVEQGSRDFPSPRSTELHRQGKMEKRKPVTSEPQIAGRSLVE